MRMPDIIKERKDQYMKGINHDILKKREEFSLQLRKDKLQDLMMRRRYKALTKNLDLENISIWPSDLDLNEEFINSFFAANNKLELALRYLKEKDLNLIKFGICQLRNFSIALGKNSEIEMNLQICHLQDIFDLMMNYDDSQIIFEAAWVIINITQYSTIFTNFYSSSEYFIKGLFSLLKSSKDYQIKNQILWIFANLMGEGEESYKQITNYVDIINYEIELILNHEILPNYFKCTLFWILGNFFKYAKESSFDTIYSIFPHVIKYLNTNDEFLFSECLFAVFRLAHNYKDEVFELLKNSNLMEIIVPLINTKTNNFDLRQIFGILINLTWKDESNIKKMFDLKIFDYMEKFLYDFIHLTKNDPKNLLINNLTILKDFLTCISNFASCNDENIKEYLIKETKINKLVIQLLKYFSNKEIVYEIMMIFYNILGSNNRRIKTELLRIEVPEIFCEFLSKDYDASIILICLHGIYDFLEYGRDIMPNINIVKEHLDNLGIASKIEKFTQNKNEEVFQISNQILIKYFNNDGI